MAKGLRRRGREPEVKEKVVRIRDTNEKSKPGIVSRLKRPQNTEEATSKTSGKIYSSVQKEREKVSKSTSRGKRRNIHPLSASFNGTLDNSTSEIISRTSKALQDTTDILLNEVRNIHKTQAVEFLAIAAREREALLPSGSGGLIPPAIMKKFKETCMRLDEELQQALGDYDKVLENIVEYGKELGIKAGTSDEDSETGQASEKQTSQQAEELGDMRELNDMQHSVQTLGKLWYDKMVQSEKVGSTFLLIFMWFGRIWDNPLSEAKSTSLFLLLTV